MTLTVFRLFYNDLWHWSQDFMLFYAASLEGQTLWDVSSGFQGDSWLTTTTVTIWSPWLVECRPSIHFPSLLIICRVPVGLQPVTAYHRWPWTGRQLIAGLTHEDKHFHTSRSHLWASLNPPMLHVFEPTQAHTTITTHKILEHSSVPQWIYFTV